MRSLAKVYTAMVTPFRDDLQVDYGRAADLARRLVEQGSDGIVVSGTTGESPTLTSEEKIRLLEAVLEAVGDRASVMMGTGSNSTENSMALSKKAEAAGAHALLVVVPYYNKPPQEGLYRHFRSVAGATGLPIMLYNIPGRTGVNMAPETVARLAEIPNIVAIKEASGSLDQVSDIARRCGPEFKIYSGDDSLTLPMLAVGGVGVVSVASHLVAGRIAAMIEVFFSGKVKEAAAIHRELMPIFKGLFVTTNPIPVKQALALAGFEVGGCRPPLDVPMGERETAVLKEAMQQAGVL